MAPAANPRKANHAIFFKYQKKSIFSIPIATTPAAEPIINILPPVPAEYAIKCQTGSSIPTENIPILAATSGTLSITAEPTPRKSTTKSETKPQQPLKYLKRKEYLAIQFWKGIYVQDCDVILPHFHHQCWRY